MTLNVLRRVRVAIMEARARFLVGAVALVLAISALTGCRSDGVGDSGPMTPNKLAQKVLDYNHKQNTANPLESVSCDPQSVQADGSGTYECTEMFQSGGMSWRTITVSPDGSWR
jgi:hypothetical protein